ncbi:MAG: phosphate ABC transporter permease PtsA, partial [Alphaproteobacteria bacterium]|nr:phosphate ABC transporter permease PtsA [Alphaproteobacteria bacterium]
MDRTLYLRRKAVNGAFLTLSAGAALFGLAWLGFILFELIVEGIGGLGPQVFTEMTPPPGSDGGLLNAIAGSIIMSALAVAAGTPIGILAGTYLAEYGRHGKLSFYIRFLNDILLSAPSIVIGIFIDEVIVRP